MNENRRQILEMLSTGKITADEAYRFGTERRPVFTIACANGWCCASVSKALRNLRSNGDCGARKRDVCAVTLMFSIAAARRSSSYVSSRPALAFPSITRPSFQPRLSASCMPEFPPRAPNGLITCAASPANSRRPTRNRSSTCVLYSQGPVHTSSNDTAGPRWDRTRSMEVSGFAASAGSDSGSSW